MEFIISALLFAFIVSHTTTRFIKYKMHLFALCFSSAAMLLVLSSLFDWESFWSLVFTIMAIGLFVGGNLLIFKHEHKGS